MKEALELKSQLFTEDFAGWIQLWADLPLKDVTGIRAVSEISRIFVEIKNTKYYSEISLWLADAREKFPF